MEKKETTETDKAKRQKSGEITFRCQRCRKQKQLEELRAVTRFFPLLVVCQDCEREMR